MLTWKFHTGPIYDLAFTPDGRLLTCSSDQTIRLWDVSTHTELRRWECREETGKIAVSPDKRLFASCGGHGMAVWRIDGEGEAFQRGQGGWPIAFYPSGKNHAEAVSKRLLTAGHDELVRVWAAPSWDEVASFDWKIGRVKCLTVSRDGTLAAAGGDRGKVVVWDRE